MQSHELYARLRLVVHCSLATELVGLHILPNLVSRHLEWIDVAVVGLTIGKDDISSIDLTAINAFVAHTFSDEAIEGTYHRVANIWVEIPRAESIGNLTEPGLTSDDLGVHIFVSNDVDVTPPTVKHVAIVLMVHAHIEQVHGWKMASCR